MCVCVCVCVDIYMYGDDLESAGQEKREVVVHKPAPSVVGHLPKSVFDHFPKQLWARVQGCPAHEKQPPPLRSP